METQEQELIGTNAKETNSLNSGNEQLITQEEIENTPFKIISDNNDNTFVALGGYKITETMSSKQLSYIVDDIKRVDWKVMCAVIGTIAQQTIETYRGEL